jgi:hypothetical protein
VFSVWKPSGLSFAVGTGSVQRHLEDSSLRFEEPPGVTLDYRVTFGRDETYRVGSEPSPPPRGSGSEIIRDTARGVLTRAGIEPSRARRPVERDAAAIGALESWLRTEKGYTLEIAPAPRDRDPTEWFIEEAGEGHCEYFASALALMCRDVGIRSRVVTGYLGVADEGELEFLRVRRSDAHAWVEAEVLPGVWRTFDATPAAFGGLQTPQVSMITRWLSSLESAWLTSFISYDARAQSQLSRSLDRAFNVDRIRATSEEISGPGGLGRRLVPAIAALAFSAGCIVLLVRLRRGGRADGGARYEIPANAAEARDALERSWAERELARPAGVTLAGHAARVDPDRVEEALRIERLAFRSE